MITLNRRRFLIAGALVPLAAGSAGAAGYPERPVRVIIPYAAGGVGDAVTRLLATGIERRLGQKLVIEAKPGAAGNIGTLEVARAEPDGYTILLAAANNFVINQFLIKMPVDPLTALAPVAKLADVPIVLFSNPSVPARTLAEFIAYARANPGKLNYGTPSSGTVNHLFVERLKQAAGLDIAHVPFRGSPPATMALLANEIQLFPVGLAAGAGHLRDGTLTALAVATERRLPALPEVATVIESGFLGFTASNWWGMAAPKGTPDAVVRQLHRAVAEALGDAAVAERFSALGLLVPQETREQFASSLKPEADLWLEIIQRGNIAIQ
jgi:tripartite-type tricarboxylate transporter receptor subunit TctC